MGSRRPPRARPAAAVYFWPRDAPCGAGAGGCDGGGEGLLAGWLLLRYPNWTLPAWLLGVVWMMLAYLVGETFLNGWAAALADLVGGNWLQALAGLLGVALYYAVRAAYPPITQMRFGRAWKEL